MRQVSWKNWTVALGAAFLVGAPAVRADVTSDQAAAVVVWPMVNVGGPFADDTLIQLSNTSNQQVSAHCFYINANNHCTNTGNICSIGADCSDGGNFGLCLPGWNETDFRIRLTARQPIAWRAEEGLLEFCKPNSPTGERCIPINGTSRKAPDPTQSNAGTRIPPVPEEEFIGELKCVVVDDDSGEPILILANGTSANVLKGEATLEHVRLGRMDVGKYNAIGIKALPIDEAVDDGLPNRLVLLNNGPEGDVGEYEGCPNVIVLNHFFDFAIDPTDTSNPQAIFTWPVFVPCKEDLLNQVPGVAIAQYLIYNEFEQRFSTSNTVQCFRATGLSRTDTIDPSRSLFNVGIAGTLVGQTRVSPVGGGLMAVQLEVHSAAAIMQPPGLAPSVALATGQQADVNVHYQGRRAAPDYITLP